MSAAATPAISLRINGIIRWRWLDVLCQRSDGEETLASMATVTHRYREVSRQAHRLAPVCLAGERCPEPG